MQLESNDGNLHQRCQNFKKKITYTIPANNDPLFHMFWKWIHEFNWLNSRVSISEFTGFCEQIWCVHTCLPWNHQFFTWWHVPVKPYQFWPSTYSCQTHSKLVTTGRTCAFTWIHMKTHTGGAVPIMNQYDMCQLVQKWFLVCWVL